MRDDRLITRALRQRWPQTDTLKALAVRRTALILSDEAENARAVNQAVRNVVAMEAQNQRDEHAEAGLLGQQVNVGVEVTVKHDEGFYGNAAHRLASEGTVAPSPGPVIPSQIQSGGVWPAVGQNGAGSNGQH